MRQRFKILATHTGQVFGRIGSFWYNTFGQPAKARKMVNLSHQFPGVWRMLAASNNLAGSSKGPERVVNHLENYKADEVMHGGDVFYDHGSKYGDTTSWPDVYNGGNVPFWILPVKTVVPYAIQTPQRKLLAGIDFFVHKDEFILFRQNPAELFENQNYLITHGRRPYLSLLARSAHAHTKGPVNEVVRYVRSDQTLLQFRRALCQLAGLAVLPTEQLLVQKTVNALETIYTFTDDVLRVDYPHVPLMAGRLYPAGTVIGPGIQVFHGNEWPQWWRAVDWKGGISLDPLLSTKGLFLFDFDVPAYGIGQDDVEDVDTIHARFPVSGSYWRDKEFWTDAAARETKQGTYLNQAVGVKQAATVEALTDLETYLAEEQRKNKQTRPDILNPFLAGLPGSVPINPLDVMFTAAFQPRAMVVTIDMRVVKRPEAVFRFLAEESPIGATMIVLAYGPRVTREDLNLNLNNVSKPHLVRVGEGLVPITQETPPTFALNRDGKRVDFVTIKQETQ